MNVNLANRNILRIHTKFKKYSKLIHVSSNNLPCRKFPFRCDFSTFLQHQELTFCINKNRYDIPSAQIRYLSEKSGPPSNKLPQLMPDFPKIIWPSLIKSIRNFILATFIIKPYLDREFTLPDFVMGSKKAVEANSS